MKSITVDYRRENASKLIFPSSPVLANKKSENLQIYRYQLAPHEAPRHAPIQDVIVTYNDCSPLSLRRELGGTFKDEVSKFGDMMVSPANVSHSACWDRSIDINLLAFAPGYISQFAFEDIDPDRIDVLPQFSQPDPLIYAISQTLLMRLDDPLYIDMAASYLAVHMLRNYCSVKHQLMENVHTLSRADLRQVLDYIDSHIEKKKLSLTELSNLLGMSRSHFGRLFKKSTGVCPAQHIIKRRLETATHLLASTNLSLEVIAQRTGFAHKSHLSSTFSKHFFVNPTEYRKKL